MLVRFLRDFHGRSDNDPAGMCRHYRRGSVEQTPTDLGQIAVEAGYAVAVEAKNLGDAPDNRALGGAPKNKKFPAATVDKPTDSGTRGKRRKPRGVTRATLPRAGRKVAGRK